MPQCDRGKSSGAVSRVDTGLVSDTAYGEVV